MKVLVTGGAGFIGGHTAAELLRQGHAVTIFDNLSTGDRANVPAGCVFHEGDIRDRTLLMRAVEGHDAVIHLAAYVSLPGSFEHARECVDINVAGTANVIEAASGVASVVLASSSAVYSASGPTTKTESESPEPGSPYADSKLQAERLLLDFCRRGGRGVALRYFNVYGPRQAADSDYAAVIPLFIQRALAGEPLLVYGDGTQTRDFVHVEDVARANVAAMQSDDPGPFNVGTGAEIDIITLGRTILQLTGSTSRLAFAGSRPGDVAACTADASRARACLRWAPSVSLSDGLSSTITWWEETSAANGADVRALESRQ